MNKGVCMKLHHPSEHIGDAEQSLQLLREGNQRFVQGQLCDKSRYALDREILPRGTASHADSTSLRSFQGVVDTLRPAFQVGDSVEMMTRRSVAYMVTRLKDAVGTFTSKASVVGGPTTTLPPVRWNGWRTGLPGATLGLMRMQRPGQTLGRRIIKGGVHRSR